MGKDKGDQKPPIDVDDPKVVETKGQSSAGTEKRQDKGQK